MATKSRRQYDRAFKVAAVRLVTEGGRSVAAVARELGIARSMLDRWRRLYTTAPTEAFPGQGHLPPAAAELRRLQRENAVLQEERAILKKALAIFSQHPQ